MYKTKHTTYKHQTYKQAHIILIVPQQTAAVFRVVSRLESN